MAKDIKKMHEEEDKLGLNKDEIAFYYALSKDEVVKEFMSDETLKKIAHELTESIRRNVTIDFNVRTQAQATMRKTIRRLLKKYDYPPEHAKDALNIVMKQVELMCSNEVSYDVRMDSPIAAETRESYSV
jgi:type I restriction enzyme R subunit